jgi:uncharacterized protein
MNKGRIRRVQDSVHGLMDFEGLESIVIDTLQTPELQRLRRIRQLGLAHLVFPGAEHSRLVHCLGASYVAVLFGRHLREVTRSSLAQSLRPNEWAIRDLALAALLHDLGHGPLSHVWEQHVIGEGPGANERRSGWAQALGVPHEQAAEKEWHEIVTIGLLSWEDGPLHRFLEHLESGLPERIASFIAGSYYLNYLPRLLASDVDVDRADFLKRDAYQTGVAYGRYDLHWLISTSTVGTNDHRLVVGFEKKKAVRPVEQFLVARKALYETVYHHKTVRSAEGMVGKFLKRFHSIEPPSSLGRNASFLAPLLRILGGETLEPRELLTLDDYGLWVLITETSNDGNVDPVLRDLAGRIVARDLFKLVPVRGEVIDDFVKGHTDSYERILNIISQYVPGDPEYYLYQDRPKFRWFGEVQATESYFVDERGDSTAVKTHSDFVRFDPLTTVTTRFFTVREAIEPLVKLMT